MGRTHRADGKPDGRVRHGGEERVMIPSRIPRSLYERLAALPGETWTDKLRGLLDVHEQTPITPSDVPESTPGRETGREV